MSKPQPLEPHAVVYGSFSESRQPVAEVDAAPALQSDSRPVATNRRWYSFPIIQGDPLPPGMTRRFPYMTRRKMIEDGAFMFGVTFGFAMGSTIIWSLVWGIVCGTLLGMAVVVTWQLLSPEESASQSESTGAV